MGMTNLKIVRMKKGISQWKLASQIGIDPSKLSQIETGRLEPSEDVKKACARMLKMSVKNLFN